MYKSTVVHVEQILYIAVISKHPLYQIINLYQTIDTTNNRR